MIYKNSNTINEWYFNDAELIKVYKNGAICYYKMVLGETPSQEPCFAVVDDISSYQDREFADVYDNATSKWYKLNNLSQYEQYGVYGEGRNITYYVGKLTIDEGYEYEWDGSQWVNLGEAERMIKESGFTISDIESDAITSNLSDIEDGMFGVILPVSLSAQTTSAVALIGSSDDNVLANLSAHTKTSTIGETNIIDYAVWRFYATSSANTYYIQNVGTGKYWGYQNVSSNNALPLVDEASKVPVVFSSFTKNNVTALGICKGNDPYKDYAINDLYADHYRYNWFNTLSTAGDLNNSYVIYKVNCGSKMPPQYTQVKYIYNNTRGASINTGVYLYDATGNTFSVKGKVDITYESGWGNLQTFINAESVSSPYYGFVYRFSNNETVAKLDTSPTGNPTLTEVINADGTRNIKIETTGITVTHSTPLGLFSSFQGSSFTPYRWSNSKIYNLSVTKNGELVRDFVPAVRKSDKKAGLYDTVTKTFYQSANSSYDFIAGDAVSFPKYYTEMEAPENNVVFTDMEEALAYQCPWVGMRATIDGELYEFNSNNEWEELHCKQFTDGTYTYYQLEDVTVPRKSISINNNLYVPYDFEPDLKYSIEFTPLNFWTTSYYGFILGNGDTSYSERETEEFHVFKMDNGWGSQFYRFGVILHNYNLGTRSGQGLPGAWTVYENVRAKIETHLVNYAVENGATITVENEGYETYIGTSTKTVTSSWSPTYGVKNICLFGTYPQSSLYSANMKFHNFAVKTSTDELVYNYVPVERQSDGKLGVYDTVHNVFYLANDYLALVAGDYVYGA